MMGRLGFLKKYSGWIVLVCLILFPLSAGTLVSGFYISLFIRIFIFGLVLLGCRGQRPARGLDTADAGIG
jgi:hypothetical protein